MQPPQASTVSRRVTRSSSAEGAAAQRSVRGATESTASPTLLPDRSPGGSFARVRACRSATRPLRGGYLPCYMLVRRTPRILLVGRAGDPSVYASSFFDYIWQDYRCENERAGS